MDPDDVGLVVLVRRVTESPDSLEIGTPGKGGALKIYGDFSEPEAFRDKIKNAYQLRLYAAELLTGGGP